MDWIAFSSGNSLNVPQTIHTATVIFATRSARELPIAKIVRPRIASDRPKMRPNVYVVVFSRKPIGEG